jgi:hypothetical protein
MEQAPGAGLDEVARRKISSCARNWILAIQPISSHFTVWAIVAESEQVGLEVMVSVKTPAILTDASESFPIHRSSVTLASDAI